MSHARGQTPCTERSKDPIRKRIRKSSLLTHMIRGVLSTFVVVAHRNGHDTPISWSYSKALCLGVAWGGCSLSTSSCDRAISGSAERFLVWKLACDGFPRLVPIARILWVEGA